MVNMYPHLTAPMRLFMKMATEVMDDPSHIFLCGSRRFGYHISSSDTDITVYLPDTGGANEQQIKSELKKRFWFINYNMYATNSDDYDVKLFNILVFQVKELNLHIRVHRNLHDYLDEYNDHELIEKNITPQEINDWVMKKLECLVNYRYVPNGTSFYTELCRKYANNSVIERAKSIVARFFSSLSTKKE